jgi:uncharacterized iron-regulated protein
VAHYLELEIFKQMADKNAVLSMEMFESDVQHVMGEYLAGLITEDHLIASARAWRNYKSDYRPLVEFAKERNIPVIAANAPRRYVNRVSRLGASSLHALDENAKQTLPPLPYSDASPAYAQKFEELMKKMKKEQQSSAGTSANPATPPSPPRDPRYALQAQSLWDASMAHSIVRSLERSPSAHIVHVNGSFHTEGRLGILDHLKLYKPDASALVVTITSSKTFPNWKEEMQGSGDYVIVTDGNFSNKPTPPSKSSSTETVPDKPSHKAAHEEKAQVKPDATSHAK